MAGNLFGETLENLGAGPQLPARAQTRPPQQPAWLTAVDKLLEEEREDRERRLRVSQAAGDEMTPDRAARISQLSRKFNLPEAFIQRNFEDIERRSRQFETPYTELLRETPVLAEWAANPTNAALARDDMANLGFLEWLTKAPTKAVAQGQAQFDFSILKGQSLFRELSQGEHERMLKLKEAMTVGGVLGVGSAASIDGWFRGSVVESAKLLPQLYGVGIKAFQGGVVLGVGAGTLVAIAGQFPPFTVVPEELITVPAAFGGAFLVGAVSEGLQVAFWMEAGLALDEFEEFEVDGQHLDPDVARMAAIAVGAINAALEVGGGFLFLKAASLAGLGLSGALLRRAVKAALARPSFRAALFQASKRYGTLVAQETGIEVAQEVTLLTVGEIAKGVDEAEFPGISGTEVGERLLETAVKSAQAFSLLTLPGSINTTRQQVARDRARAEEALHNETFFKALGEGVTQSETFQNLPEAGREFIAEVTKDGPITHVYAPANTWRQYWTERGMDPAVVLGEVTGDPDLYQKSVAANTDIPIPLADYAARLAGSEHNSFFMKELRLAPEQMNAREAEQRIVELDLSQEEVTQATEAAQGAAQARVDAPVPRTFAELPAVERQELRRVQAELAPPAVVPEGEVVQEGAQAGQQASATRAARAPAVPVLAAINQATKRSAKVVSQAIEKFVTGQTKRAPSKIVTDALRVARERAYIDNAAHDPTLPPEAGRVEGEDFFEPQTLASVSAAAESAATIKQRIVDGLVETGRVTRPTAEGYASLYSEAFPQLAERFGSTDPIAILDRFRLELTDQELPPLEETPPPGAEELAQEFSQLAVELEPKGFRVIAEHLTDEELQPLRRDTAQRLIDIFKKLPPDADFSAAAQAALVKRGWYQQSTEAIRTVFGDTDAPRFAAMLAALSVRTSVESNLINAVSMWVSWVEAGRPTDRKTILKLLTKSVQGGLEKSVLTAWKNNTVRALTSAVPATLVLSGPKVNSFMLNLSGNTNEVTVDAWMGNFVLLNSAVFGGSLNVAGTLPGKSPSYLAMIAKIRRVAKKLTEETGEEWTPSEVQETVWSWAKTLYELAESENATAEEMLRAGRLTDALIAGTPDFKTLFTADTSVRAVLEGAGYGPVLESIEAEFAAAPRQGDGAQVAGEQRAAREGQEITLGLLRSARRLDKLKAQREQETALKAQRGQEAGALKSKEEFSQDGLNRPGLAELIARIKEPDGGFTYDPITGVEPKTGFAVSIYKGREGVFAAKDATVDKLAEYVNANRDILEGDGNHFGAWHNPEDGQVYLDVSIVVATAAEAEALGREHGQIAYFDLESGNSVTIPEVATSAEEADISRSGAREGAAESRGPGEVVEAPDGARPDDGGARESAGRTLAAAADPNVEFSQTTETPTRRGFFRVERFGPERQFTIGLLETANLSTFLHETGHLFLEVLGDLSQDLRAVDPSQLTSKQQRMIDDYDTLLRELGVSSREQLTGAHHDRLAEMFEDYLREGKAPSAELRQAFARFRAWLLDVYKSVRDSGLNDEVRGVFDRMLASDEAIAREELEGRVVPMFTTAESAGMTEAQFAEYQGVVEESSQLARDELQSRTLRDLTRTKKKWWKEERAAMRDQVEAEIHEQPVYRALAAIQHGTHPDGTELPGAEDGPTKLKLDKEAVLEIVGSKEALEKLPRPFVYTPTDGHAPDVVAQAFGFQSGAGLVQALQGLVPMVKAIEAETDRRMLAKFGDIMTDDTQMAVEAEDAVYGTHREKVVKAELKALTAAIAEATVLPTASLKFAAAKRIAALKVRDLRPGLFLVAAQRASKRAFDLKETDRVAAVRAKQDELLNLAYFREAMRVKDQVEKRVRWVRDHNTTKARARIAKAGPGYLEQWDGFLGRYEFANVTLKELDRRQSLRTFIEGQEAKGIPVDMPDEVLDQLERQNHKDMPIEQFMGVTDSMQHLLHMGRMKDRLLKDAAKRDLNETAEVLRDSIALHSRGAKKVKITHLPQDELVRGISGFFAWQRKLSSLIRQMDGGQDGGPMWEAVMRIINRAVDDKTTRMAKVTREYADILKATFTKDDLVGMNIRRPHKAVNEDLARADIIMIALNWGNAHNRQRVMQSWGWNEDQVKALLDTLEQSDWDFVKSTWTLINAFWPEVVAKEIRVYGFAPTKVEALPFSTKFGIMPGGYFPIKYDPRTDRKAFAHTAEELAKQMMAGHFSKAMSKRNHAKERVDEVQGRKVRFEFSAIFEHINEVLHDLTHHEMLIDVNRILGHEDVAGAITEHYGDQVYNEMLLAVKDIAAGDIPVTNFGDKGLEWLRVGTSVARMGWNTMTSFVQPLGITVSIVRVGPKWVAKGISRWLRDAASMESSVVWIQSRSKFMKERARTFEREVNDIRNKIAPRGSLALAAIGGLAGKPGARVGFEVAEKYKAVEDSYFWLIGRMQMVADIPTWLGAYEKAMADSTNTEDRAVDLADQAVRDSQGSGLISDLARSQRGAPSLKLFTQFMGYFSVVYNQGAEASARGRKIRDPFAVGRLAVDLLMLYTVPMLLETVMREAIRNEHPDEEWDEFMVRLAKEQVSYLMNTFVLVRELAGSIQGFDYSGPAGTGFFQEGSRLMKQVLQGEADEALFKALNQSAGVFLHYPATQIQRIADAFVAFEEEGTEEALRTLLGGKVRR